MEKVVRSGEERRGRDLEERSEKDEVILLPISSPTCVASMTSVV